MEIADLVGDLGGDRVVAGKNTLLRNLQDRLNHIQPYADSFNDHDQEGEAQLQRADLRPNLSTLHSLSLCDGFDCKPDKDEGEQKDEQDKNRERADYHGVPPPFWRAEGRLSIDRKRNPPCKL
jgi:hypothetical protein